MHAVRRTSTWALACVLLLQRDFHHGLLGQRTTDLLQRKGNEQQPPRATHLQHHRVAGSERLEHATQPGKIRHRAAVHRVDHIAWKQWFASHRNGASGGHRHDDAPRQSEARQHGTQLGGEIERKNAQLLDEVFRRSNHLLKSAGVTRTVDRRHGEGQPRTPPQHFDLY